MIPDFEYMRWAKTVPRADINLARSGVETCPLSFLRPGKRDFSISHPPGYGWEPLRRAIADRYEVGPEQVFPVSGGASMANWVACMAALDGCGQGGEVIVERPGYEALIRVPEALGARVRRLDRRFGEKYAIDIDRFANLVNQRTRLAIVSNLHNPTGVRIPMATLRRMASILRGVGALLLVDEVYLECLFRDRVKSAVHAGPNVLATNSLTKAYGLDGLRAGWILGPRKLIARAGKAYDLMEVNDVAPGDQLALLAFRHLRSVQRRADWILSRGLAAVKEYLESETRLSTVLPPGGNVIFPRLPAGVDGEALSNRLRERYSTLVVPGSFFESPRHIRVSFGIDPDRVGRGLENLTRTLDELL